MRGQQFLTPAQIANRLQLNERTITLWLRTGRLRGSKLGKAWRVAPRDLNIFLEKRANIPPLHHRKPRRPPVSK